MDVIFSANSNYIASGDSSHAITLWERQDEAANTWNDMGRFRTADLSLISEFNVEFKDPVGILNGMSEWYI